MRRTRQKAAPEHAPRGLNMPFIVIKIHEIFLIEQL